MLEKIKQTAEFIKSKTSFTPKYGIVLGSGLGGLVTKIKSEYEISYSDIPNFPVSTVHGHAGKLMFGHLGNTPVLVMQGRFHFYEGWTMEQVVFPIRVMKYLGIDNLILSNAAGGMNKNFQVGDLMIIEDHINLMPSNPLIGKNDDNLGPRFPDMSVPYNKEMIARAKVIADEMGHRCHIGVYAAVSGPCFETPAEYKYLRIIGADVVGMSTVPEVIAAKHCGMNCFAMSIVTDLGGFDDVQSVSHEEVLKVANEAEVKMSAIVAQLLNS